jgi:hypothetical protein
VESFCQGRGHSIAQRARVLEGTAARVGTLLLLLAVGCAKPRLQQVDGELRVGPASLEVKTWVGFPVERSVEITNTGRAAMAVAVDVSSGLTRLGSAVVDVPGGQTQTVTVQVRAEVAGPVAETLGFTIAGARSTIGLTGEILEVPACEAPEVCHAARFDAISGSCVDALVEDGASCAGACLQNASCQAGACVGVPKSCDDGNLCTLDSCGADGACAHTDTSASCFQDCKGLWCSPGEVPCKVPACDPLSGCVMADVADGTACGSNDCSAAHVCMEGTCTVVAAPEGSACSEETPCRTAGKCVSNSCVSTAHDVKPSWEVLDTPKVKRTLLGVVSPAGLIFAVERHDAGIFIVAYDSSGFERWRTPLYSEFWSTQALYDVDRGQLLVISKTWARAFDGATGAQKWFVELNNEIPLNNVNSAGTKQVYPLKLSILPASKRLVATYQEGSDVHVSWVFGLDLVTGAQLFKIRRDGHLYGLMTTATDEIFLGSAGCWQPASWNAAFDHKGVTRWDLFNAGVPSLTSGTQLYFQPYTNPSNFLGRIDLATGAMSQEAPNYNRAVLADGARVYVLSDQSPSTLTAWDTNQHKALWSISNVQAHQNFLIRGGGVVAMSQTNAQYVSDSGKLVWSCWIGPLNGYQSASLTMGQLVGQTSVGFAGYPFGKLEVSPTGWSVSERGNPERTLRAR